MRRFIVPTTLLFLLATGAYLVTRQAGMIGDGVLFDEMLAQRQLTYYHVLYLPLVDAAHSVLGPCFGASFEASMKAVSGVFGGIGVAICCVVARRMLGSTRAGVLAALTLMGLTGYWYHATGTELHVVHATLALVLFVGLLGVLDEPVPSLRTWLCVSAGCALTPASHIGGLVLGLPLAYTWLAAGPDKRSKLLGAAMPGLGLFAAAYLLVVGINRGAHGSTTMILSRFAKMVGAPGTAPSLVLMAAGEFFLYSLPASCLVPAGLRLLFRDARRHAWLCLLWLSAWPLGSFYVGVAEWGSYPLPTFAVQAILAVHAFRVLGTSHLRAVFVVAIAALPAVAHAMDHPGIGVALAVVGSIVLFVAAGSPSRVPEALPSWRSSLLPLVAAALATMLVVPALFVDVRKRIRTVSGFLPRDDLVLYLADTIEEHHHWRRFLPGANDSPPRAYNPVFLDYAGFLGPNFVEDTTAFVKIAVDEAMRTGRAVWVVGEVPRSSMGPRAREIVDHVHATYRLVPAEGGPPKVWRVRRR